MRRTKHRRRFHTRRVIENRKRRYREESPAWYWCEWWNRRDLKDGHLEDRNAFWGCGNSRCYLCHWDKLMEPRRYREKQTWQERS